jgi:hypothetical protein
LYAFHLAVGDSGDLANLVGEYQYALEEISGFDLIPREWLHVTMQGLDFVEHISIEDLATLVKAVRAALTEIDPFSLTFDRPLIRPEALVLVPDPVQPLTDLRVAVRTAIEKALGPDLCHVRGSRLSSAR